LSPVSVFLRTVHRFKLIFTDFDVSRLGFLADADAVYSGTVRTQVAPELRDSGLPVSRVTNLDEGADFDGFGQVLRRDCQGLPSRQCERMWSLQQPASSDACS